MSAESLREFLERNAVERERDRIITELWARMEVAREQWLDDRANGYLEAIAIVKGQQ